MSSYLTVPGAAKYGHCYDNKARLASYWHQIDESIALGGKSALVVGKGSGLPTHMLLRRGFEVTTLDIQIKLEPTVVGDVRRLPFSDQAFDIAVCCQVLEHLPFEFFGESLRELRRVIRRGLVLSLPDHGRYSTLVPRMLRRKVVVSLPNIRFNTWISNPEHFWEVNTSGHRLSDIQRAIDGMGLKTERTYRVWEIPCHRFWRLSVA